MVPHLLLWQGRQISLLTEELGLAECSAADELGQPVSPLWKRWGWLVVCSSAEKVICQVPHSPERQGRPVALLWRRLGRPGSPFTNMAWCPSTWQVMSAGPPRFTVQAEPV